MKTRYDVIPQRNDDTNQLERIFVPAIPFQFDFLKHPDAVLLLKEMGERNYLEYLLDTVIQEKAKNLETIGDDSTMALMTQGYSALATSGESYDIYFIKNIKQLKPRDIDGVGIIIVGETAERQAFIISNQSFYKQGGKRWSCDISLSPEQVISLKKTPYDATHSASISIENCLTLEKLKKTVCNSANWIYMGPNCHPIKIMLTDKVRRPCHFFATVLPIFTRGTALLNLGIGTVLNLGLMDAYENPFFPSAQRMVVNNTTGEVTVFKTRNPYARPFNWTQMSIDVALSLLFTLVGPRQRSVYGLGLKFDDFFIGIYRRLYNLFCCVTSPTKTKKETTCLDIKVGILKALLYLAIIDQLLVMGLMSFLRINTLSDYISKTEDPLFPIEVIQDLSLASWGLYLGNEPLMLLGELAMAGFLVEYILRPKNTLQTLKNMTDKTSAHSSSVESKLPSTLTQPLLQHGGSDTTTLFAPQSPRNLSSASRTATPTAASSEAKIHLTIDSTVTTNLSTPGPTSPTRKK